VLAGFGIESAYAAALLSPVINRTASFARLVRHRMQFPLRHIELDQVHSSYLVLATLAFFGALIGVLYQTGILVSILRGVGLTIRNAIRIGFQVWRRTLAWAPTPLFLGMVFCFLFMGWLANKSLPVFTVLCGLAPLFMGVIACLAYMFIDLERYQVERGYKAVHNPLKGQELASHLAEYGPQVRLPLLAVATISVIFGFALLNQGLYESIGRNWYRVGDHNGAPSFVDFLAYGLINLFGIVDVLNVANHYSFLQVAYVHQNKWPASTLLIGYRIFFTFVLLQQIFASLRQGRLLSETIADFWSPHEPIRERARNALPQYGAMAIGPLLISLRSVQTLAKEQRDQLPQILAAIGPSTIPGLLRHLQDSHEHIRAIVVATLGHLHAIDYVGWMVTLVDDESDMVRQSLAEALGSVGGVSLRPVRRLRMRTPRVQAMLERLHWLGRLKRRGPEPIAVKDPMQTAVTALKKTLSDSSTAVRNQAAISLGMIGAPARALAPDLIGLLHDSDETVRCQAALALGKLDGATDESIAALTELLQDPSAAVMESAARALGSLKGAAAPAVASLVPLLQDRDETVRSAAAETIAKVGTLDEKAKEKLVEGLASDDDLVKAQAAEALGTIGETAQEAAPALVAAVANGNARVKAKAVEALGKIGEAAADVAVPSLVHALRGGDSWVSALAAEALGEMGEAADEAVPALMRSLRHANATVRGNAAAALAKMGTSAASARHGLEKAAQDQDGSVRSQAVRALGTIGPPTEQSMQVVRDGLQDLDPLVRAGAVEAVGEWGEQGAALIEHVRPLLTDANDEVKVQTVRVLPKLAGETPEVIEGLCRRLQEDDSVWVREQAAAALGKLGAAALSAGPSLLRAVQTGEASVRLEAIRAIALIQPPETMVAFAAGIKDSESQIRKVASAGWMIAPGIPEEVIPALIEALRDPEVQVRANAANALSRLEDLPSGSIPLLIECTSDPSDGLRMNAAMALKLAPREKVEEVMHHLLEDTNIRIRLIAAGSILPNQPEDAGARTVLAEALNDPAPRVHDAAQELASSLKLNLEETRNLRQD
jgi:HEAT repeat protein